MSNQTYDDLAITQYLLGALPAAAAERLDELSLADDKFADALLAAEKDLVDAYIQGELAGAELERFESYYLASPLRREKVEFARAFKDWSARSALALATQVKAERFAEKRIGRGWFSVLSSFTAPRLAWQWSLAAAALVLFVAGGLLVFQNVRLRQQMAQTQAGHDELLLREQELKKEIEAQRSTNSATEQELASLRAERELLEQELKKAQSGGTDQQRAGSIVSLILAPPVRGAGQISTVTVPAQTEFVAAQLELESADYSAYRVALIDPANNQTLWRSGKLTAKAKGESKTLNVSFPARLMKPRNYILQVSGVSAGGVPEIVSDYPFKVVR